MITSGQACIFHLKRKFNEILSCMFISQQACICCYLQLRTKPWYFLVPNLSTPVTTAASCHISEITQRRKEVARGCGEIGEEASRTVPGCSPAQMYHFTCIHQTDHCRNFQRNYLLIPHLSNL